MSRSSALASTANPPPGPAAAAAPASAPVPLRQRRKQTRPQELLDAALTLFVEKGFAVTRAEEVARAAGVSKGTLYLYYPSKEELFKAVVRHNLSSLIAEGMGLLEQHQGSSSELLVCLMTTWWERVGSTPAAGIHKVVLSEVRNFPELADFYSTEVIEPGEFLFSTVVQRGIDSGEFRPVPVREVAHALMAPMILLSLHRHSFGACQPPCAAAPVDALALMHTHLDLALRGLQVRQAGAQVAA